MRIIRGKLRYFNDVLIVFCRVSLKLSDMGLNSTAVYNATEVFTNSPMGQFKITDKLQFSVNPTGVFFGKVTPIN